MEEKENMLWNDSTITMLQSGLDALNMEQKLILHNLANADTPGFKAKSVEFQDILANTRRGKNGAYHLQATVYQDNNPMRPDENTVDPDKESLALYENYVQQLAMYNKIGDQFSNLRYAINQLTK